MKKIIKIVFLITVTTLLLTCFIFIAFGHENKPLTTFQQYEIIDDIGSADDGLPVVGNYNSDSRNDISNYEVIDDIGSVDDGLPSIGNTIITIYSENNTSDKVIAKINTANVNFRKEANMNSDIYYKLEMNTDVEVINSDIDSGWCEVRHLTDFCSSTIGFVSKQYLTF